MMKSLLKKLLKGIAKEILSDFALMLKNWDKTLHLPCDYHEVMEKLVETKEIGFGKIGMPLRVSLTWFDDRVRA